MKWKTIQTVGRELGESALARVRRSRGQPLPLRTLNLSVTYKCDSRCVMCGIWKYYLEEPAAVRRELDLEDYDRLFRDSTLGGIDRAVISGGEPFLRNDLVEIVSALRARTPVRRLGVVTNGLRPKRIAAMTKVLLEAGTPLGADVSLDGLRDVHDEVRGRPDAFERAMETLDRLRELRRAYPDFQVGVGLTVTPGHAGEIAKVRRLAEEKGVGFTFRMATSSPYYGSQSMGRFTPEERSRVLEELAIEVSRAGRDRQRFLLFSKMADHVRRPDRQPVPCLSGFASCWVDPYGDVYPCIIRFDRPLGNVRERPLAEIWTGPAFAAIRREIRDEKCACWTECEANPTLRLWRPDLLVGEVAGMVRAKVKRASSRQPPAASLQPPASGLQLPASSKKG